MLIFQYFLSHLFDNSEIMSNFRTNDLQYLTSEQMLYDVAIFIKAQQANQKLTGPWITFGGSYPG